VQRTGTTSLDELGTSSAGYINSSSSYQTISVIPLHIRKIASQVYNKNPGKIV